VRLVVVTGASGFIGRRLCQRLRDTGVRVRAVMRAARVDGPWDESFPLDLSHEAPPEHALDGAQAVFHLAGKVHALAERAGDETEYRRINVEGTGRLLEAARIAGVARFVFLSSVQAMGDTAAACADESVIPRPATPYGRSKQEAEGLVLDEGNGIPHTCCLRPPLVYGPGQKGNLHRMIRAVDRSFFPPLPDVGNKRSMIHVRDVVEALLQAADRPQANRRCYIVTDGRAYSSREIHDAIARALGRRAPRWHVPLGALRGMAVAGDWIGRMRGRRFVFDSDALHRLVGSAWYSAERIERELGFQPTTDFVRALPEIVSAYRNGSR
jgi:UDP-glucose 4-epimerase